MQFLSQTKKCNVDQLLLPKEILATLEIFHIPNLLLTLPGTKLHLPAPLENTDNMKHYISSILDIGTNKTILAFTDGSAQSDPGSTGSGMIIKKQGRNSTPIKIAKAAKCMGSNYQGELEAIKIATEYARNNLSDCQSAILAVTS